MTNVVVLQGRITGELEVKVMNNQKQTKYLNFSIAVPKTKDEAIFVNLKAYGETAENISKYFQKGKGIIINGKLDVSTYEKDGAKNTFTYVNVTSFDFPLETPKGNNENAQKENENVPF